MTQEDLLETYNHDTRYLRINEFREKFQTVNGISIGENKLREYLQNDLVKNIYVAGTYYIPKSEVLALADRLEDKSGISEAHRQLLGTPVKRAVLQS